MHSVLFVTLPLAMAIIGAVANVSHSPSDDAVVAPTKGAAAPRAGAYSRTIRSTEGLPSSSLDSILMAPIAPLNDEEMIVPPSEINIAVELIGEGFDDQGHWLQTLRVTIKSGGTLADASYVLYGDESYYEDLFEMARQKNPELKDPGSIRAGEQIEVVVDPTATYVVRESSFDDVDEKMIYKFFNGGEMAVFSAKKSGVIRTIDFPNDSRAKMFSFRIGAEILQIPPGSRLAEYSYRQGDAFAQVVKQIYGSSSAKALQDFIVKTGYTPDRWPPTDTGKKRIIFPTTVSYADERVQSLSRVSKVPPMNEKMKALMDTRATAGIFPLVNEDLGTVYQFQVTNPDTTAKDASRLLFGTEDRYLYIADQAGILPKVGEDGKIAEDFDPPLLGRSFELFVEYNEERFLDGQPVRDDRAQRTVTRLVNGTYVEEYDRAARDDSGVHRAVYYPTGYKKVFYQADELTYTLADFLFFVSHSGRTPEGPVAKEQQVDYIGKLIWDWAPGVPREPGDIAEGFRMYDTGSGKLIEITVAPRPQTGILAWLAYNLWLGNPLVATLSIVLLATGVIVVATVLTRRRW